MSQLLDVMAGAEYEQVAAYAAPMVADSGGGFFGALQSIGTGYLSRRIDIDLQNRVMQQGTAQLRGGATGAINQTVSGNMLAGMSNSTMLVLGAVALIAVVLAIK
jgi:hypothetical protein